MSMMLRKTMLLAILMAGCSASEAETVSWDRTNIRTSWNKVITAKTDSGGGLTAEFRTGAIPWPYVVLYPEKGKTWDFSGFRYISFEIENLSRKISVGGELNLGMWARHKIGNFVLEPGAKRIFTYPLNHEGNPPFDPLFNAKWMPSGFKGGKNIDTSSVKCIHIICGFAQYNKFRISGIRVHGARVSDPAMRSAETFFPFIDRFGQYMHEDWQEKIRSDEQLRESFRAERSALKPRVAEWNKWGGWRNGPQRKATGYFRLEKYEGKWYYVDPDGRLFFSRGVNALTKGEYWPADRGKEKFYAGKITKKGGVFNFYSDNCRSRYGGESWHAFQFRRMESWGYNTVGNWSDPLLYRARKMPYVLNLPLPRRAPRIGNGKGFHDVYAPEFESELLNVLQKDFKWTIDDPYCIGYFVGNELKFGNAARIAGDVFLAGPELPAKRLLLAGLKEKYGEISGLNKAWNTSYSTWDSLKNAKTLPDPKKSRDDFEAFAGKLWNRFFQLSRKAVKTHAPNHLYLGSRFYSDDYNKKWLFEIASNHCDVVSINNYTLQHDNFHYAGLPEDKPVMITESSVGHRTRGMFGTLAYPGCAPGARETAQRLLLESAARHPQIVGIHHFAFKDQTLIGRWDGENYGFGLVAVTDVPYRDFVEANRVFSEKLYRFRWSSQKVQLP